MKKILIILAAFTLMSPSLTAAPKEPAQKKVTSDYYYGPYGRATRPAHGYAKTAPKRSQRKSAEGTVTTYEKTPLGNRLTTLSQMRQSKIPGLVTQP